MFFLIWDEHEHIGAILRQSDVDKLPAAVVGPVPEIESIPQDPQSPAFGEVSRWLEKQPQRDLLTRVVPSSSHVYFETLASFIDFCKESGFRLVAWQANTGQPYQLSVSAPVRVRGLDPVHPVYRLNEPAVLPPGATGFVPGLVGVGARPGRIWISSALHDELVEQLNNNEDGDVDKIATITSKRAFVFLDISDFSKYPAAQQSMVMNALLQILNREHYWRGYWNMPEWFEASLCIGDGYIFAFRDAYNATCFAAHLARMVDVSVAKRFVPIEFHFRMGVHVGPVYRFWDPGRKDWNYIGDGINGGNRVLSAIGREADDILFISDAVRRDIVEQNDGGARHNELLASLVNRGRRSDKHGNLWRVFEVHFTSFARLHADFRQ